MTVEKRVSRDAPPLPVSGETALEHDDLFAAAVLLSARRTVALTGAGVSTESGIPDYRGPRTLALARGAVRSPMRFSEFLGSENARRRYWARASLGWARIEAALPNPAHLSLAALESMGRLAGVITQNVDGLHGKAGSARLVELHGALRDVVCLDCGAQTPRASLQQRLRDANPSWQPAHGSAAPDGDTDLPDDVVARFRMVACDACGGAYKPRVVFFGENVAPGTLEEAWTLFDSATALLVVGSSLEVFSGRRFVMEAKRRRWPIVIINQGPTRCDADATLCLDGPAGVVLPALVRLLAGPPAAG